MKDFDFSGLMVVDTETTGVNPFENDIVSIGLCVMDGDASREIFVQLPESTRWSNFAKDNFSGFLTEWESESVSPREAVTAVSDFVDRCFDGRKAVLVGHNFSFDRMFLQKLFSSVGMGSGLSNISHRSIDTYSILKSLSLCGVIPESATSSDGAFKYFGISIPEGRRHTALADALATKELFLKLMDVVSSSGSRLTSRSY